MTLTTAQTAAIGTLLDLDPTFREFLNKRLAEKTSEVTKLAAQLGKVQTLFSATKESKPKGKRGRPRKDSKKPVVKESDEKVTHKDAIKDVLGTGGDTGLSVSEIKAKLASKGRELSNGALNTYLYGMKKSGELKAEGKRGSTRYLSV